MAAAPDVEVKIDFNVSSIARKLQKLREGIKGTESNLKLIKRKVDEERRRIRQTAQEARRLALLNRNASSGGAAASFTGLRSMADAARGSVISLGSAAIFDKLVGGPGPMQSALAQGLSGLVTGGLAGGALGLISGVVTGLIGEVQILSQKVENTIRKVEELEKNEKKERERRREVEEAQERRIRTLQQEFDRQLNLREEGERNAGLRVLAQQQGLL